jgi:prevent-host-death family protein
MKTSEISVFDTKTHLSDLLRRVMRGERFYITRRGQRVAEIRPVAEEKRPLERGCAKNHKYFMSANFDESLDDLKDYL